MIIGAILLLLVAWFAVSSIVKAYSDAPLIKSMLSKGNIKVERKAVIGAVLRIKPIRVDSKVRITKDFTKINHNMQDWS